MPRSPRPRRALAIGAVPLLLAACMHRGTTPAPDAHAGHDMGAMPGATGASLAAAASQQGGIAPGATEVGARLAASPRHGEWAMIPTGGAGGTDSIRAWVVYPERRDKAPVVMVVHEIFGLTNWVRGVADQLAADGFIAIAPDLLTGKRPDGYLERQPVDSSVAVIRTLRPADVAVHLDSTAAYARRLAAASGKLGITGFCWGGGWVLQWAGHAGSRLDAGVLYYGAAPADSILAGIRAPILGLYGGDDARVNATIPRADSLLKANGRRFTYRIFEGAGHGFLRQQDGRDGANLAASRAAWPMTVTFFRERLR